MKIHRHLFTGAASALGVFLLCGVANASSHREAPAISADPAADNTDLYAWVDGSGNLVVVANYNGLEMPEGAPNWQRFSDDVLYEVHLARGGSSLADAITYQIRFTTAAYPRVPVAIGEDAGALPAPAAGMGQEFFAQLSGGGAFKQTYSVTKVVNGVATVIGTNIPVPPPNVGPTTNLVVNGFTSPPGTGGTANTYEGFWVDGSKGTVATLTGGEGRVFAGPRDDPFYVDLGAIFDLAQVRPVLKAITGGKSLAGNGPTVCTGTTGCNARDSIAYTNVHSIVLEIPGTVANGGTAVTSGASAAQTVGVWASASRHKVNVLRYNGKDDHVGPWQQVSRLGIPLINETVIGLQDKDYWNRTPPSSDAAIFGGYFDNLVAARDADAIHLYDSALAECKVNGSPPFSNRLADVVPVINLWVLNNAAYGPVDGGTPGISSIGDVLRVDLGTKNADFPNGRRIVAGSNVESVDVVDTEIKLLFCTLTNPAVAAGILAPNTFNTTSPYGGVPDGVNNNDTNFRATFPYLASPWEGFSASPRPGASD